MRKPCSAIPVYTSKVMHCIVVICVCREGCGRLVAVVAVGESGEVAGPVGVDGGGGWNGMSVG